MLFSWTSDKREVNLRKHGFDFLDAEEVFNGPTMTVEDVRDYGGEQRYNTTGFLGMSLVTICHTETKEAIHVISMRRAAHHEIEIFVKNL
jgi:uncharacterized DUF497 family protein